MAGPWQDVSYPRVLFVVLTLVVGAAFLVGGVSSTSVFGVYNPAWDGVTDLRDVADTEGAETVIVQRSEQYASVNASRTVSFVLSPDSNYTRAETDRIEGFVRSGGTLVVAEDFGTASNPLLERVGAEARVDGGLLRDERVNGDSPEFPVATDVTNHSHTTGVDEITLNRGTTIEPNGAQILVNSSNYSYVDRNLNGELDDSEVLERRPVVTVESIGRGAVVVVGDPSLFINAMLERSGNRAFAVAIVDGHDVAAFDVSHVSAVPPLVATRLALQRTPLLQVAVGFALVVLVSYWGRVLGVLERVRGLVGPEHPPDREPNREAVERRVGRRFPDWDQDRVRRVTEGIIQRQQEEESNE